MYNKSLWRGSFYLNDTHSGYIIVVVVYIKFVIWSIYHHIVIGAHFNAHAQYELIRPLQLKPRPKSVIEMENVPNEIIFPMKFR